ncbi:hypothetical protein Pint_21207 [Pistacia integerrima]|uniref:Uncharacterized protein n=1 Tax=Pistacia integerrima TaxID=434235 RepID=A0ACC0X9R9_9ROSI|nr:hypothetical protein Pint_21207 [Pistacia integerrima]
MVNIFHHSFNFPFYFSLSLDYRKYSSWREKPKIQKACRLHKEHILSKHTMPEFVFIFNVVNFHLHERKGSPFCLHKLEHKPLPTVSTRGHLVTITSFRSSQQDLKPLLLSGF